MLDLLTIALSCLRISLKKFGAIVFLCLFFSTNVWGVDKLKDVAYSEEWLALVHYQEKMFKGYESTVDSEGFFLSKYGKDNPEKELYETIDLFLSNDYERQCRFVARYKFLRKKGLVPEMLTKCSEYDKFYEDINPSGVTLLFTNAYMNNPSSLFGHTLFRIDTKRKGTQLLAHGVNYGAMTGDDGGILFAVLGLTGGYMGSFVVKPYYDVINMYNNIENRDIWELNLELSDEELDLFMAHIWELGHSHTKYFFFTKNCSYMLMEVLDAIRPELRLAKEFPVHAIPLDTFKAVNDKEGLVKGLNFRPSRQSKILYQYKKMSKPQKKALMNIIRGDVYEFEGLSEVEKAEVLDTAYQYIQFENVKGEIDRIEYRKKSFAILKLRNEVKEDKGLRVLEEGLSPLETHSSMRASVGAGFRNGEAFEEISFRPAYHSLTDNGFGYLKGAEINFLNTILRHYRDRDKYVLEQFDFVGIKSLSPVNDLFSPYSYQIDVNIKREMDGRTEDEGYVLNTALATGLTYEVDENIWVYGMIVSQVSYGGFLNHNSYAGLGGKLGTLMEFGDFRLLGEVERIQATDDFGTRTNYSLEGVYSLSKNVSLGLKCLYRHNYGKNISEPMASLRWHFY